MREKIPLFDCQKENEERNIMNICKRRKKFKINEEKRVNKTSQSGL